MPRLGKLGLIFGIMALALALVGGGLAIDAAAQNSPTKPPDKTDNSGPMLPGLGL